MNKFYELFSLVAGLTAIFTIVFYLLGSRGCLVFFEPILWIRILEISIGFFVLPYYLIKLIELGKRWAVSIEKTN